MIVWEVIMDILKNCSHVICSVLHNKKRVDITRDEYYGLPFYTPKDFKEIYFLIPFGEGTLIFTKEGMFRNENRPLRLIRKVMKHDYTKKLELGLMELLGKRCHLKPYFNVGECMQPLYRHRDNPPFLNLCHITDIGEMGDLLYLAFYDYQLILNYPKKSLEKKLCAGMDFVRSCHLFLNESAFMGDKIVVLFLGYNEFIRGYLLSSNYTASFYEQLLRLGTLRFLIYQEWLNYSKKFPLDD